MPAPGRLSTHFDPTGCVRGQWLGWREAGLPVSPGTLLGDHQLTKDQRAEGVLDPAAFLAVMVHEKDFPMSANPVTV